SLIGNTAPLAGAPLMHAGWEVHLIDAHASGTGVLGPVADAARGVDGCGTLRGLDARRILSAALSSPGTRTPPAALPEEPAPTSAPNDLLNRFFSGSVGQSQVAGPRPPHPWSTHDVVPR